MESIFFDFHPGPGVLLSLAAALLVALSYEFINGFHDTANAVATVIYTRSLSPTRAVVLSGLFNFLGVMASGVGVAYSIVNLLPVEVLVSGGGGEFAIIFSVLLGAMLWNAGTWYLGIPASSSHTLIGAIIGVGLTHSVVTPGLTFGQGVHWYAAEKVAISLFLSPLVGFGLSFCALVLLRTAVRQPDLYRAHPRDSTPPGWIRGLLVGTCAGVSFAHGSNDGQKGMGLIMLILIGLAPYSFALNLQARPEAFERVRRSSMRAYHTLVELSPVEQEVPLRDAPDILHNYLSNGEMNTQVLQAMTVEASSLAQEFSSLGSFRDVPQERRWELRTEAMLLIRSLHQAQENGQLKATPEQLACLSELDASLDSLVEYVCDWVKLVVAVALGIGTMVGWKRVVVTVGEKIGKTGLTYGQGVVAQSITMATILAGDGLGLPVSTTHILSSGVAGTMLANHSGVQSKTLTSILLAWVLTLPATIGLSSLIYLALRNLL